MQDGDQMFIKIEYSKAEKGEVRNILKVLKMFYFCLNAHRKNFCLLLGMGNERLFLHKTL